MSEPSYKVVCAWCHRVLVHGPEPTSHGICPECSQGFLKEVDSELTKLRREVVEPNLHSPRKETR